MKQTPCINHEKLHPKKCCTTTTAPGSLSVVLLSSTSCKKASIRGGGKCEDPTNGAAWGWFTSLIGLSAIFRGKSKKNFEVFGSCGVRNGIPGVGEGFAKPYIMENYLLKKSREDVFLCCKIQFFDLFWCSCNFIIQAFRTVRYRCDPAMKKISEAK